MDIVWDPAANSRNIMNHKIDFNDARRIFRKPMLTKIDNRKNYGEERRVGLGVLEKTIVVVNFKLQNNKTHVVAIRRANHHEREIYQERLRQSNRLEKA